MALEWDPRDVKFMDPRHGEVFLKEIRIHLNLPNLLALGASRKVGAFNVAIDHV